nr:unnamed protein product [uncultured bacterium]
MVFLNSKTEKAVNLIAEINRLTSEFNAIIEEVFPCNESEGERITAQSEFAEYLNNQVLQMIKYNLQETNYREI